MKKAYRIIDFMKNRELFMVMSGSQIFNCIKKSLVSRESPSSNGQYTLFFIGKFHMVKMQGVDLFL